MFLVMKCSFNFSLDRSTCIAFKLYKPLNFEMIQRQGILILLAGWPACLDLDLKKKKDLGKQAMYWDLGLKILYKGVEESSKKYCLQNLPWPFHNT